LSDVFLSVVHDQCVSYKVPNEKKIKSLKSIHENVRMSSLKSFPSLTLAGSWVRSRMIFLFEFIAFDVRFCAINSLARLLIFGSIHCLKKELPYRSFTKK